MLRTTLKIFIALLAVIVVTIALLSIAHPIIPKWIIGTARIIGRTSDAMVYTNGIKNNDISVYKVNKYWQGESANTYLLSLKEFDSHGRLKFININLNEKWIGAPTGTSNRDYDFVAGLLLQSETGGHFSPFEHDMKGYNFSPQLHYSNKQIMFNLPPGVLKFDSIRIQLAK